MIRSFRHRGLKRFYERGDRSGIRSDWLDKVEVILGHLDTAASAEEMNYPGYHLHELKGRLAGFWSVRVSRNWRITFRFEDSDAYDVNLIDYH
ncbi:MAG: type II toxin-antitoxin system RelE/ParE family toxin [Anaerolineaceae bacterium]|nr:type II toxin-antitoxin system RelE/ParE family toxin [Anaerolineaceae bacterium]MCY3906262.1 type II toxin-antitoxin system RelE/ParE family toxin [Anaerolineaceae bacterium]